MDRTEVIVIGLGALSFILWWSLVNADKFQRFKVGFEAFFKDAKSLDWLSEVLSHTAFYGLAISGFVGFEKDSVSAYYFAGYLFTVFLFLSYSCMKKAELLDRKYSSNSHKEKVDV